MPSIQRVHRRPLSPSRGRFVQVHPAVDKGSTPDLRLPNPRRWVALVRNNGPFWQGPVYGAKWEQVPAETQLLLWQNRDDSFGVVLPLVDGDWRSTARGVSDGLIFDSDRGIEAPAVDAITVAYIARGHRAVDLVHHAMDAAARRLKTFRLREEKAVPAFIDYLGWCTWDAFYQEVSQAKVRQGLRSLERAGIRPGFMILDDGWLDVTGDLLNDLAAHPQKFPNGLASTVQTAKTEFGIRYFGVWHALQGYWAGLNPAGKLAGQFKLLQTQGILRWWENKQVDLSWVSPEEITRFYHDFYRWLRQQGVDFVKTDGQSALEKFSGKTLGRVSTMARYQEALQGAAMTHFATSPIHCMCNGSDIAFHFTASNLWRNSDDFFPKKSLDWQQWHVHVNAINNLWTSTFSIPDWDMFQTNGPAPAFHAAARALSGGPIYICDKPGKHDTPLINKLVISDRRVLRFPQPALPAQDILFNDFRKEKRLLKITNYSGALGAIGLFHCTPEAITITDSFRASDVAALSKNNYAVYLHRQGTAHRVKFKQPIQVMLNQAEFEIATLSPIENDWAVFGLLDKYNSAITVLEWRIVGKSRAIAHLSDGGRVGFLTPAKPSKVMVNDRPAKFTYHSKSKLLVVMTPAGEPVLVEIRLGKGR